VWIKGMGGKEKIDVGRIRNVNIKYKEYERE
jgi:hypothetical protein